MCVCVFVCVFVSMCVCVCVCTADSRISVLLTGTLGTDNQKTQII